MNIYMHEWRSIRKSTLIWSCSLIAVMLLFLSMFSGISADAEQFRTLLNGYPESVRKALGISIDSISTLLGFYSFVYTYILLCAAIQAMNVGLAILSKEAREKTADFLLTKPVTRSRILTSKLLAAITSLVVTNIIYLLAASIMVQNVKESTFHWGPFLLISASTFFVQLMFLSLGIIMSVLIPKIRSVLSVSLGTVFGFFVIGMLGSVLGDEAVRYITPFKYFVPTYMIQHSAYELSFIVVAAIFVIVACTASYFIYAKKDIHAV
ncbi:MAG: ABC transporter permease [Gorillibacterium sp.]|nr:ABC transporter permease [Gorillibacterium sp.]